MNAVIEASGLGKRYRRKWALTDCTLSVPPGTGPLPGMVLTAGLRLLRFRWVWMLAAAARAAGVVLVGRRR